MKRLAGITGILLGCGVFLSVSACDSPNPDVYEEEILKEEVTYSAKLPVEGIDFQQVTVGDVPSVVKSAIAARYSAYVIDEAFADGNSFYKLVLKNRGTKLTVYYSGNGEFLRKETCVFIQGI